MSRVYLARHSPRHTQPETCTAWTPTPPHEYSVLSYYARQRSCLITDNTALTAVLDIHMHNLDIHVRHVTVEQVGWLEFNVPFQHKYGYIRDDSPAGNMRPDHCDK